MTHSPSERCHRRCWGINLRRGFHTFCTCFPCKFHDNESIRESLRISAIFPFPDGESTANSPFFAAKNLQPYSWAFVDILPGFHGILQKLDDGRWLSPRASVNRITLSYSSQRIPERDTTLTWIIKFYSRGQPPWSGSQREFQRHRVTFHKTMCLWNRCHRDIRF